MPKWLKNKRKVLKICGVICLAILLIAALVPRLFGYPQWVASSIARGITPKDGSCEIGHIRGALLTGFTIEELVLKKPTKAGLLTVHIPEISTKISLRHLLFGKVMPTRLLVDDASAVLELYDETYNLLDAIILSPIKVRTSTSQGGQLTGTLSIEALDMLFKCDVRLDDANKWKFSSFKKEGKDEEVKDGEGFRTPGEDADARQKYSLPLMRNIHQAVAEIRKVTKPASTAYIVTSLTGSLADFDSINLAGTLGLSDTTIYGRPMLRTYGKFNVTRHEAFFPEFHIVFNDQESLSSNFSAFFDEKSVEARFQATLMPDTLFRLIDLPVDLLPRTVDFTMPIRFNGNLAKASWDLESIAPILDFNCENLFIEQLAIRKIAGQFTYSKNSIDLKNLFVQIDTPQENALKGNMHLILPEKTISGTLQGNANIGEILRQLQILKTKTPIDALYNTNINAVLNPSPLQDWHLWDGKLSVQQTDSVIADFPLQNLMAELKLKDKHLVLDAEGILNGTQIGALHMDAQAELPENLNGGPIGMTAHINIRTNEIDALDATAKCIWEERDFRIDDGHAAIRPELLNPLMEEPLKLDEDSPLAFFQCLNPDTPAQVDFNIPPVHATGCWQLRGNAVLDSMRILNTDFATVAASILLTEEDIDLQGIQAAIQNSEGKISCGLKIHFDPLCLYFNDADVIGKPTLISNLLYDEDAIQIYNQIWQDFQWTQESHTHIHADTIEYIDLPPNNWSFRMKGNIETRNFAYNDMPLREMATDVDLVLPEGQLTCDNIRLADADSNEDDVLQGSASLQIEDSVGGIFHLEKRGGRLRTMEILLHAFSTLEEDLRPFDLAPEANFTCDGRFHLDTLLVLVMQGTIEAPQAKYNNFVLQNLRGTWGASNNHLAWDIPEAEFYGGTLATTGQYSFLHRRGELMACAENLPLSKLLQTYQAESKSPEDLRKLEILPGKLNAAGHFTFFKDWAKTPIHIEGTGEAHVKDADLWRIPTFYTLGKILADGSFQFFSKDKVASLGKITKVDSYFDCLGTTIRVNEIKTDGSIIALKGSGKYNIDTKQLDFLLSGELMKSISIISFALRPITWAFDAHLTGTPEKYEWKLQSPLSKIF